MRITPILLELVVLALWLGAAIVFAAVVAPSLFATLPTRTLAGTVVGRVLPSIFYSGIVVGLLAVILDWRARGEWVWRSGAAGGLVVAASCMIAQLLISPRIERVRASMGGALETLSPDDPRRLEFGRLHAVSVAWLGLAMLAAGITAVVAARAIRQTAAAEHVALPGLSDD